MIELASGLQVARLLRDGRRVGRSYVRLLTCRRRFCRSTSARLELPVSGEAGLRKPPASAASAVSVQADRAVG